jgi:Cytochrome c7 and related cytochrome c
MISRLLVASCVVGALILGGPVRAQEATPASTPIPYPSLGVETGVWNGGQAAFWDLDIIDSYRLFGAPERAKGYKPDQPIVFSHQIHVQQNKMECQFCHWNVAKSSYAAIPEVETCMGCHRFVDGRSDRGKEDIKTLREHYEKNEPIPWVKVHVMPDHVRFNHKRHVKAGIGCHECHGQVPEMVEGQRVTSMKMGWCIDCHREKGTSIDCWTCHK